MISIVFATNEWAAAVTRGVRQCVVIGSRLSAALLPGQHPDESVKIFEVDEGASESLATAIEKTDFDKLKASLFVWLGGTGYRSMDAAIATLSFIASLPRGSGVLFDYAPERSPLSSVSQTALDSLASKVAFAGGNFKLLIQPQAVAAMLQGMGFRKILDLPQEEAFPNNRHLVSALL